MTRTYDPIDWPAVHGTESFIHTGDCYQECDSYCCTTNHPDFAFRFIRPGQVQLPIFPDEYRYLKEAGVLPDDDPAAHSTLCQEFGAGKTACVHMVRCDRAGLCRHPRARPLICKIYPYLPLPSPEGEVERLALGSVFDWARHAYDGAMPCPARAHETEAMRAEARAALAPLFRHPQPIFYFRAGVGLMEIMAAKLTGDHAELRELAPPEFFRKWEVLYMTGQLTPGPEVRAMLAREYEAVAAVWGQFPLD